MQWKLISVGPLQSACSILSNPETKEAMIIDPGGDATKILSYLSEEGLKAKHIIHTHAHVDHLHATSELKEKTDAKIWIHEGDHELWNNLEMQCVMCGIPYQSPLPAPDGFLKDGDSTPLFNGTIIHTPGHSPGSVSFYFPEEEILFSGDLLFQNSIGRTDLWGGDYDTLINSIKNKIYTLNDNTKVIPGHGPSTSIEHEKLSNPFVKGN